MDACEAVYRRTVAAERAEAGRPPSSPVEAAHRRIRRALRQAYERSRGLGLLFPLPFVRSLRVRASRLQCQVASFGAVCAAASVEIVERALLAVAAVVATVAVTAPALPASAADAMPLGSRAPVLAPEASLAPAPVGSGPAAPSAALDAGVSSAALAPGAPRVGARTTAGVDRQDRIVIGRRVEVEAGDYEVSGGSQLLWFSCDPNSAVRRAVCSVHDEAAPVVPAELTRRQ